VLVGRADKASETFIAAGRVWGVLEIQEEDEIKEAEADKKGPSSW
jgi:hypothetical protein